MFVEKQLEDYICENKDVFIKTIKNILNIESNINFVGRQIHVANKIFDVVFEISDNPFEEIDDKTLIICELKINPISLNDLHQLIDYMNISKHLGYDEIYGIIIGPSLSISVQDMSIYLDSNNISNIIFIKYEHCFKFSNFGKYSHKTEFVKEIIKSPLKISRK